MQDHWGKVHGDLKDIYEEISAPDGAKPKGGEDKAAASAKKVRQAIYDIRYRSGQKNLPLNKVYQDYMQGSGMDPKERALVKAKIASSSQKEEYQFEYHMSTLQFDEQTGKYKVRVTDKTTGKSFMRSATREKISQLRNNPNISSVEMTAGGEKKADKDYDGDGKVESGTDEYMGSRDKAIKKAMSSKKEELEVHETLMSKTLDKMEEDKKPLPKTKMFRKAGNLGREVVSPSVTDDQRQKAYDRSKKIVKTLNKANEEVENVDVDSEVEEGYKTLPKEKMARQSNKAYGKEQRAVSAGDEKETNKQMQRRIAMQNPAGRKAQLTNKEEVEVEEGYKTLPKEKMARQANNAYGKEQRAVRKGDEKEVNKQMQRRIAMQNPTGRKAQLTNKEEVEVTEKKKDDTYLEPDMKKRQANNEKARKELDKGPQMKNPHFEEIELPFGDMKALIKKAAKRVDADVDGDVDAKDKKSSNDMGEYVPTPDGKKKTTRVKEGYSWRDELIEVMGDKMDDESKKKIDVMKGKNRININPPLGEEVNLSDSLEAISEGSDQKYCRLCMKKESRNECSYGGKMFDAYSVDDATDSERSAASEGADGGGVSESMSPQEMQVQRKQLQLNRLKIQNQQKALQGKKKSDAPVTSESVLHEMNEVEVDLISQSFIDKVVEEFFVEYVIENQLTEDEIDTLVAEMTLEINESLILTEETDVLLNEKLGMIKKAIKSAGSVAKKAVVGGAGLASRAAGTAVRAVKKAGGVARDAGAAAKAGYKRGVEGSGSSSSAPTSSTSTSTPKKSGTSTGKKLVSGLKKVASGTASMAAKAAKKTASVAKGAAKVAAKTTQKVVGKTARGISKASSAAATKLGEEMSVKDQMAATIKYNKMNPRKPYKDGDGYKRNQRDAVANAARQPKDTRTDAQKMSDATGPRKGSNYRGD